MILLNLSLVVSLGMSQGISLTSGSSIGQTCSFLIDAGAAHAGQGYMVDISFMGSTPGVPLGDGTGRVLPLNGPWIYSDFGHLLPQHFQNFVGQLNGTGQATAGFLVPFAPSLLGFPFDTCFVTYVLGASEVGYISPPTTFTVTDGEASDFTVWVPLPTTNRV